MKKTVVLLILLTINLMGKERIVTLSPSLNEIVFALGKGGDIVANTQYCNYPEESKKIPKIGGYSSISLEKLLLAKPTIVLTQDYDKNLLENLKKLSLNFHTFKTNNLDSIKTTIIKVGNLLEKEKEAVKIVKTIDNTLSSLKNIVKNKKILVVISPKLDLSGSVYIAGNNLYFSEIMNASGNTNAYQSKSLSQPIVNVEKIVNMNPDIVILLAPYILQSKDMTRNKLKGVWKKLPINANKNDNIYIIDKEYAGIPSNRVIFFMNDFKKILEDVRNK